MAQPRLTTPSDLPATSELKWRGKSRLPYAHGLWDHMGEGNAWGTCSGFLHKEMGLPLPHQMQKLRLPQNYLFKDEIFPCWYRSAPPKEKNRWVRVTGKALYLILLGEGLDWGWGECHHNRLSPVTRHLSFKDQRPRRAWRCSMPRARGPTPPSRRPWTGRRVMQWRWGQRASSCSEQASFPEGRPTHVVCSPHGSGSAAAPSGSPGAGISLKPRLPRPWPTPRDLDREGGKP